MNLSQLLAVQWIFHNIRRYPSNPECEESVFPDEWYDAPIHSRMTVWSLMERYERN